MQPYPSQLNRLTTLATILWHYNRRGELARLAAWAARKGLVRPLRLYRSRVQDEDVRLAHAHLIHPTLAQLARVIYCCKTLCFRPARYPRRGLAKGYARRAGARRAQDRVLSGPHRVHTLDESGQVKLSVRVA